ncbi:MAG: HAMP domain-containing histidine kinase [Tidjanibacter sp.]|nr:HAMP domain-containing histidine kinase [Tidjanibacter sp.]
MAHTLNKRSFSIVSVVVTLALALLTIVQCAWVWKTYNENIESFRRRVQSATYRTIYKSFRNSDIQGTSTSRNIYIDLPDFATWFEPYLKEMEVYQPYYLEVINHTLNDKVMMRSGNTEWLFNPWTFEMQIDDRGMFSLRLTISEPRREMLGDMWLLILSSGVMVVVLAASFIYLRRTLFRYRSLEEMRRNLTHNITHELKTPISVARVATDALINFPEDNTPEREERYLRVIDSQLTQLADMVQHILDSSLSEEAMPLSAEEVEVLPLLQRIAEQTRTQGGSRVTVEVECDEATRLHCDRFHLSNTLSTIADNSLKYSTGEVHIALRCKAEGGATTITISDNGPGIASRHLPHIFDKFYRVPSGDRHDVRGNGLGLYYARSVVERHGGTIGVESTPDVGTTITITLPNDETE